MCLKDLFKVIGDSNSDLGILQRSGIRNLVDQLHEGILRNNHNPKILELLGYVCSPGGKCDKRIQELVLEMVVGRPKLQD